MTITEFLRKFSLSNKEIKEIKKTNKSHKPLELSEEDIRKIIIASDNPNLLRN